MSDPAANRDASEPLVRLRALGAPFLGLVVIEFLLGMSLNLLVTLPTGSPATILESSPLLDLHVVLGVLLLGISGNAVRLASRSGAPRAIGVTLLGLVSGFTAFGAGLAFAFGDQSPAASYAMSVGFVGLLITAGYLLSLRAAPNDVSSHRGSRTRETASEA